MTPPMLVALAAAGALAACAPRSEQATLVRLHNASPYLLEDVQVTFRDAPVAYGRLAPGETSDYRPAAGAYRYARIEARLDGEPFTLQPIDYVGETPLEPGRYTYRIERWPERRGIVVADAVRDD